MSRHYKRYESGFMLPPVTEEQRWLEAQRIMADIIDQSTEEPMNVPGSKLVMSDGKWVDGNGDSNDFTLERYIGYDDDQLKTSFILSCESRDVRYQRIFCIDTFDDIDVRSDKLDTLQTLEQRRAEVCAVLASISMSITAAGVHYEFEQMIAAMAAHEVPIDMTAKMMNWDPGEWDKFAEERKQMYCRHRQSRINPLHLVPGLYNSHHQLQIEATDRSSKD